MLEDFLFVSGNVLCLLVVCRSVSRRLSCEIQEDDSSDDRDEAYKHEPSALVDVVHSSCAEREAWDESGKRQELELEYVDKASIGFDFKIFLKTFKAIFGGTGQ